MKKKIIRGIAALLAGTMIFSLAGCSKGGNDSAEGRKEFYYVPEYKDLTLDVNYINSVLFRQDELFMIGSSWDEETGESTSKLYRYQLLSGTCDEMMLPLTGDSSIQRAAMDPEGNLLAIVNRYEEVGGSGEGEKEIQERDTEAEDGTQAAEGAEAEDGTQTAEDTEAEGEAQETTETITETTSETASETVSTSIAVEEGAPGEIVEYKSYIELWKISAADGSVISQTDIKPVFDDPDNAYVQNMAVDGKGIIYISDGNTSIYLLDKDGNKLGAISTDGNWVDALFSANEDGVYMKTWGETGPELKPVDPDTKSLGETVKSENLEQIGYNQYFYSDGEKGILINDGIRMFRYQFASDTKEELFDWLDADINSDDVEAAGAMTDGRYFVVLHEYTEEKTEYSLALLTKTPASELPEKEEITFGTMWLDQELRKNIIDFNKSSDKYHISVKTYDTEDYTAGMTQFNNDITSGSGPDIVDISNIDYIQYASKGVFEDLYPYMERDGIHKEDYLENVFKAYEVDGKLYAVIPQFYVATTLAKASKVGDVQGWTLSEMLDFVESSNAENIFSYGSRDSVFYYCIYNNIDEFIDWETGECSFNGEDFIRVLEFAAKFPEEPDYNNEEGTSARLRADKILLMQTSLSSVQEYQMYSGLFGEKVSFVGFPNSERKGNLIQPTTGSVALSAKSKHKDGAWEFISILLSEDYQNGLVHEHGSWGFPIKKTALDKQFTQDMTAEYYEDENGKKVEQTKTSWGYDDFNIDIYAAKQEEVDAVKAVISSAERCAGAVNEELTNIITEETAAFFKGQKSAKETADIIQNRIQIYVKENS